MSMEPDVTSPRRITRAGDYDLIRRMGSGGFGVVFEARHRQTGLLYAVKRIELSVEDAERYPQRSALPGAHRQRLAARPRRPLVLPRSGRRRLLPGHRADPARRPARPSSMQQPKPLPLPLAMQVGAGIAKGLAAIHAQGIVHRDLKPANVLMDRKDGQWVPKIADFGLARSTRSVSLGEFASSGYAAPEQLDLLSDRPLGPEADLFSFGMVLYELLTGESASRAARSARVRPLDRARAGCRRRRARHGPSWRGGRRSRASSPRCWSSIAPRRTTTALACAQVLQNALQTVDRTVRAAGRCACRSRRRATVTTATAAAEPPPIPPRRRPPPQEPVPPLPERRSLVQTPPLERRQTAPNAAIESAVRRRRSRRGRRRGAGRRRRRLVGLPPVHGVGRRPPRPGGLRRTAATRTPSRCC